MSIRDQARRFFQKFVFKHLFNGVTEDDVLKQVGSKLAFRGQILSDVERNGIISEAQMIRSSSAMKLLLNDMKASANDKIFNKSTSVEEILAAKSTLWTVDILERKMKSLAEMDFSKK